MIPNDQSTRVRVNGGGLSAFDFDFGYFNNTDIKVYSIDTTVDPKVATLLTLTTDYTITADAEQGGTVTLTSATEATGEDILILLDLPYTQDTDIPAGGAFREEAIENAFDKLTLLAKQNATKIDRALSLDETTPITSLVFGAPVDGRALKFNAEGSGAWSVESSAYDPDEAGTYATAAAASAASAATSLSGAQAAELAAEAAQAAAEAAAAGVPTLLGLLQAVFPVGAVYISSISTSPATVLGFGTWSAIEGYTLVGYKPGDSDFGTVNATGGAKTVTLTAAQSGLPSHRHSITTDTDASTSGGTNVESGPKTSSTAYTGYEGGTNASEAHTNLQPYKVKYMWERTA